MDWLQRFVFFTALADEEEIDRLSTYDRFLVYASCARQVVGAVFTFVVFFFACLSFMPHWISALIASVLAMIIFLIDQAIVGSEWTSKRDLSERWLINGPLTFIVKLVQLIPRVAFAIMIAWFMATLAEISIQSRAIDRVLNERTRENNTTYFERMDTLGAEQAAELAALNAEIQGLEAEIEIRSDPTNAPRLELLEIELDGAINGVDRQIEVVAEIQGQVQRNQLDVSAHSARVASFRREIEEIQNAMDAEISDPNLCSRPGADFCRGDRWSALSATLASVQNALGRVEAQRTGAEERLRSSQAALMRAEADLANAREVAASTSFALQEAPVVGDLDEMNERLIVLVGTRAELVAEHDEERGALDQILVSTGNRDFADYGPLDRYIGLQNLHNDPVYGPAARQFSWQLKIAIILFELAPILVPVFFSPFSFLGLRMRQKRDLALSDDALQRREREIVGSVSRAAHHVKTYGEKITAAHTASQQKLALDLSAAENRDAYDAVAFKLQKNRLDRDTALAKQKLQSDAVIGQDDEELSDIERCLHIEARRQELIRAQRLTAMLLKESEPPKQPFSQGGTDA
ncbi:DUF4407 domain-containing protein [Boseongicola sp. H5]|uniref:DUF4407 domain-containing protein n=1 Tax=Boseongicola sp. H5 TaxID=2763261 RepID=UPI001D0AD6B9|nr:DUF4407 domain-containing protein [Boseongicola sp. H5]